MTSFLKIQKTCPICESDQLTDAFQVHYWKENVFQFSDCQSCQATFANPMPTDELISDGNTALVRSYQQGRSLDQEFREARQAYLRGKLLAFKLSRWKRKGRLLELGCHHGFFALGVKENSEWEVEGLEISTELCSFVSETLGLPCHLGTLEEAQLPSGSFDFVVCHDLIEHINQPQVFLRKLNTILAPGGRVQIITPNGKQDLAYTRRSYAAGMTTTMLLNHIMYFRPGTLRLALEKVGLRPLKLYCYDVRYALKDLGYFGLGKPVLGSPSPSMVEALKLQEKKTLSFWTPEKILELRRHQKTSWGYGVIKEVLPRAFTLHMPAPWEVGHEIFALAEKRDELHEVNVSS